MNKKFILILSVITMLSLITVGFLGNKVLENRKEKKILVTTKAISENITQLSELATAKLNYRGIVRYEEGQIKFITKKGFTMIYDAYVKAGVDLSKAVVDFEKGKNNAKIKITLPNPEVFDIFIDSESLEFYDEEVSIFNWESKEDLAIALEYAKQDAKNKIDETDLKKEAMKEAKAVIDVLLKPLELEKTKNSIEVIFK